MNRLALGLSKLATYNSQGFLRLVQMVIMGRLVRVELGSAIT